MALLVCHECKGQVSSTAKACPHCGAKVKKKPSVIGGIVGGLVLVFLAAVIFGGGKTPPAPTKSPEQLAAEEKSQRADAEDGYRLCGLREATKNPASFAVVKAVRGPAGELCVQYRGTNGFNAVVTETVRFPAPGKGDPKAAASCEGVPGQDVTVGARLNLKLC